jgi:hypothetical protein
MSMFYLDIIFHFGGMFVLLALIGNELDKRANKRK